MTTEADTGSPAPRRGADRRTLGWLFIGVLAVYLVSAAGQFQTIDAAQELGAAVSIVHGRGPRSDFPVGPGGGTTIGRGGHPYAGHDIGSSLLYLPAALVPGTANRTETAHGSMLLPSRRGYFVASLLAPVLGALIIVVFAAMLGDLGFDPASTIVTALLVAFTTAIWVYAHVSFDTTATTLAVLCGLWCASRAHRSGRVRHVVAAGSFLGAGVLVRVDALVMAPFLALPAVLLAAGSPSRDRAGVTKRVALVAGPVAAAFAIDLAYNWYRFGSITDNGHTNDGFLRFTPRIGEGLVGQTISPGKGLFVFSPILIAAAFRWRWFLRRHTVVAGSALAATVATLLAHSAIIGWAGDQAWGARFTVPVVPLVALPLARLIRDLRAGRVAFVGRVAVAVAAAIGFVIQLSGVLVDFFAVVTERRLRGTDLSTTTSLTHAAYLDGIVVLWRATTQAQPYPDLTAGWVEALHVARVDLWWVRSAQDSGWNLVTVVVPLLLAIVGVFAFTRMFRGIHRDRRNGASPRVTPPA
ncbi:MAG: glycosyltransferase family 39 protein [Actinobacteria bacterium]|nr:glycosyltransferase family 39 protein [Actinomycetota bacterium]